MDLWLYLQLEVVVVVLRRENCVKGAVVITDRFILSLFYCGSHEGSGEAELDVKLHPFSLPLHPLHPQVVYQHKGLHRFLHSLKLNHATSSSAPLPPQVEPANIRGAGCVMINKQICHLILREERCVVEMQNIGRGHHTVLGCALRSVKPVVSVPEERLKGVGAIQKLVRLPDIFHPLLSAWFKTQPCAKHFGLAQVAASSVDREPIVKFDHCYALFRLKKVDLDHIAVEAE